MQARGEIEDFDGRLDFLGFHGCPAWGCLAPAPQEGKGFQSPGENPSRFRTTGIEIGLEPAQQILKQARQEVSGNFLVFHLIGRHPTAFGFHRCSRPIGEGILPQALLAKGEGLQQIQRFSPWERIMHVLLILSFFTLVMTGFPLKYHDAAWSKILMNFWGGAHVAGLFHRGAALLLIAIVAYVAFLSLRFLFPKGLGRRGFLGRLFGPDSLVPNRKDLEDFKGMFLWFFDRGEMPKFDRWTYWEKFDFWAVFWGMFAIGSSGILLWVPEWSSYLVPGWVLNVASLVHSEEALLAALFIFTVHFFNTHFIPNKFPMDRIIFTGTYTLEDLKEQRPLEYERLKDSPRFESMKRPYPGIPLKLLGATFGLASLLLGLFLLGHILWSLFFF